MNSKWVVVIAGKRDFSAARRRETMTDHKTGTREEWLAARLELLKAEKELTRRSDDLAQLRQGLPWFESTRITVSRPIRARRPSPISSEDAHSSSSITSCSAPS